MRDISGSADTHTAWQRDAERQYIRSISGKEGEYSISFLVNKDFHFPCMKAIIRRSSISRGVRNPMKMSDIGFLKTEPTSKFKNQKNSLSAARFSKNRLRRFVDGFSRCLIHSSSCNMIGSTVNVFFFMPCLCTSSSESLWLTISWTNSAWKYVIA